jgi:hypothetical protein
LTFANVMSVIAVFIAIGGTSYAALKISGDDVVNGSLTGKDIKKKSVAVNRLSGKLPAGPKGDTGATGETGPPGPVDPSQFVPSTGTSEISVGQGGWQSLNTALRRSDSVGTWTSFSTDDAAILTLDPALPSEFAGKGMRLRAVTPCWNATATAEIDNVVISTFRENAAAAPIDVAEIEDTTDHTDATCKRYEFETPVDMSGGRRVSVRLSVAWTASSSTIHIGGVSFEFDRAP